MGRNWDKPHVAPLVDSASPNFHWHEQKIFPLPLIFRRGIRCSALSLGSIKVRLADDWFPTMLSHASGDSMHAGWGEETCTRWLPQRFRFSPTVRQRYVNKKKNFSIYKKVYHKAFNPFRLLQPEKHICTPARRHWICLLKRYPFVSLYQLFATAIVAAPAQRALLQK